MSVLDFRGQTILVTGGASGIGRAIAWKIAENGGSVAVADRNGSSATETADALKEQGFVATSIEADVSDPQQVSDMFQTAETFGGALHGLAQFQPP